MDSLELKFANAFNSIPNVGPATLRLIKKHFGSFGEAWRTSPEALAQAGINPSALQSIIWKKSSLHPDKELEKLIKEIIWLIDDEDPSFPDMLKEIPSPPLLIYGKGDPNLLAKLGSLKYKDGPLTGVAVVGTRKPTAYGREAAAKISAELTFNNIVVVSGLATGIDTCAHENALENRGLTIAVLGSGIDSNSIFPLENKGLARRIIEQGGVVLSEYAPGTPAVKEHFPQRNRIISGLAKGVLVVEAQEKSGALITARFALEQNREVFAVPGSIFSLASFGPNKLIQQGAKSVASADDLLEEFGLTGVSVQKKENKEMLDQNEWSVVQLLQEPLSLDLLKERTNLPTPTLLACLSMLELKGLIKNSGGDTYQRI